MKKLNPNALGVALGLLSGLMMLLMGAMALGGYYMEAFAVMKSFHFFLDATAVGVLLGTLEGAVCGYVGGFLTGWFYNKFA